MQPNVTEPNPNTRLDVKFFGRVQGVGFRHQANRISRTHAVTGFVENQTDGTVHLVAEGQKMCIVTYLAELCGAMQHYIERRELEEQPCTGEFSDFSIRR
jgi:acylphosphatase